MLKPEKPMEVEKIAKMLNDYSVIGVLDMHKIPGKQLQKIRDNLRGNVVIKMSKKGILMRSIHGCDKKNIDTLKEHITREPALILTNEDPFKLFKMIKQNRARAKAKVGDIVKADIMIPKGPTELPPGPAISTLQKAGLKTGVQQGKIAVMQDKVVLKAGEAVTEEIASVFSLLKIEPMEIGLELVVALEDGIVYKKDVLDVDDSYYISEIEKALRQAINLSVNAGYPTQLTVDIMIQKVFNEVKNLCIECNILEKEFVDDLLVRAIREVRSLEEIIK